MDTTDSAVKPARSKPIPKRDVLPYILLSILLAGLLAVLGGALFPPYYQAVPALLWSLGFCVSGMLLGFLFGIPRTVPSGTVDVPAATEVPPNASNTLFTGTPSPMEINSNLVEVSDWLTKIIIGVGLIELKSLPGTAHGVADFIAPSQIGRAHV